MSIDLLEQERAIAEGLALGRFETDYLHRATRETSLDYLHSRAALREETLADLSRWRDQRIVTGAALPEMVAVQCEALHGSGRLVSFRRHRWVRFEGGRIAVEVLVQDDASAWGERLIRRAERVAASHISHPAFGELWSGQGQRAAGSGSTLIQPAADPTRSFVTHLHQLWNARALNLVSELYAPLAEYRGPGRVQSGGATEAQAFLRDLLADLPDAVWQIDRVCAAGAQVGVLWRLFAHHVRPAFGLAPTGRRLRLIGSSLFTLEDGRIAAEDTVLDLLALHVQLRERMIVL